MGKSGGAPDEFDGGTFRVMQPGNPHVDPGTEVAWVYVTGTSSPRTEHWVLSTNYVWLTPSSPSLRSNVSVNGTQYESLEDFMDAVWQEGFTYVVHTCVVTNWP